MSWSDLFYPDNPKRRNEVVRLCTKLFTLIESNFRSTNELIDVIHKYLPGRHFDKVVFDPEDNIRTNVDALVVRIREIQDYVEVKGDELRKLLEPTLYEKLVSVDTSFLDKIKLAKKLSEASLATVGSVAGAFLLGGIYQRRILGLVVSKLGLIRTAALATLVLGVLVMGLDMIASAIIGAVERDRLEEAIKQLEAVLVEFEPESYQFDKNIHRVAIYLEEVVEKGHGL